jgi:hypothetical protein
MPGDKIIYSHHHTFDILRWLEYSSYLRRFGKFLYCRLHAVGFLTESCFNVGFEALSEVTT